MADKVKTKRLLLSSVSDFLLWSVNVAKEWDFSKPIYVTFGLKKSSRSEQQNALYWIWLKEAGDFIGHTDDELHDYFRAVFLIRIYAKCDPDGFGKMLKMIDALKDQGYKEDYYRMIKSCGKVVSTTSATVEQFTEYLDKIFWFMKNKHNFILSKPVDNGFGW